MEDDATNDRERYVAIYLQDHRAGAEAGLRLAERCRDHAPDADAAAEIGRIVTEIDEDRRALATIMAGLDIEPSKVKQVAGIAAERLGRLKLNGRAVRTSPLTALIELEGLIGAVSVKRELWVTLRSITGPAGRDAELDRLIGRADDQRTRLQQLHARVSREVFAASTAEGRSAGGTAETTAPG